MRVRSLLPVLVLLPVPASAADAAFIGIEVGRFEHEVTARSGGDGITAEEHLGYLGLKGGRVTPHWRAYAALHIPATEDEDDHVAWLSGSWDYLFLPGRALQPYLGGHVGHYAFSREYPGTDGEITAITVGPELGLQLSTGPLLFDLGYRYGIGVAHDDNYAAVDYEVDSAGALSFGLSALF